MHRRLSDASAIEDLDSPPLGEKEVSDSIPKRRSTAPFRVIATLALAATTFLLLDLSVLHRVSPYYLRSNSLALEWTEFLSTVPAEDGDFYPPGILDSEWAKPIPHEDAIHLSMLHEVCVNRTESIISWHYGASNGTLTTIDRHDPLVVQELKKCPDIDIYSPRLRRDPGYCEDAVGYAKYLETRLLPEWVFNSTFIDPETGKETTYLQLCADNPIIVFNHYWDGYVGSPEWPSTKPIYVMPNIEMYELRPEHYWKVDKVLCKTAVCARRVQQWYDQEGNPNNAEVVYTRHTSSDVAALARHRLGDDDVKEKDFGHLEFTHINGKSVQKSTIQILQCWLSQPDLPNLHVYLHPERYTGYMSNAKLRDSLSKADNIIFHSGFLSSNDFGRILSESTMMLCPSVMEGYGHYINQARAAGTTILTTDVPPMNELVTPDSGVRINVSRYGDKKQLLGGVFGGKKGLHGLPGLRARVKAPDVCQGVLKMVRTKQHERVRKAEVARKQYNIDVRFFAAKMNELRTNARRQREYTESLVIMP